ncbi:MAG: 1-phosphofructokinase family hexose kinase [Verrucomicrobiae bacterium]|nr:1-phosphofructokinase family hexose kinase [Verrucomicrobiae bacterium]
MPALILALNPSIDTEWRVDEVQWEEKNNVLSERRWAGGKGINVARWLKHLGGQPLLLVPLGGRTGAELAGYLRAEKIPTQVVRLRESTRVNVIITTKAGRQMRFNPPGPLISAVEWGRLLTAAKRELTRSDLLVLSGSLPRGLPVNTYAALLRLAHRCGVKSLLDCDGPAFAAAVAERPFLVKPNLHELAQWWRKPLRTEAEIIRAARALSQRIRGWVLVSRGAKRSLLLNDSEDSCSFVPPPRVKSRNTVGAGDALLAAVARAMQAGQPPATWLKAGVKAGSVAVQLDAGTLPGRSM